MLECSSIDLFHFKVTGMEENVHRLKVQEETSKRSEFQHLLDPLLIFVTHALNPYCDLLVCREADDLLRQLQEEQRKTISLTQEMSTSSSSRWVEVEVFVFETDEDDILSGNPCTKPRRRSEIWRRIMLSWGMLWQLNELKWFCSWRESNEKLLNSAFDMERERKYMVWNHGETTKTSKLWSFQGNRECAEGSDFSAWDNIEVGSERQKPSDWGSCKGEGGFCSDGVGFPGFLLQNWSSKIPRAL